MLTSFGVTVQRLSIQKKKKFSHYHSKHCLVFFNELVIIIMTTKCSLTHHKAKCCHDMFKYSENIS